MIKPGVLVLTLSLIGSATAASAAMLDFEEFANGARVSSSQGVSVFARNYHLDETTNAAVVFDTDQPGGNDAHLGAPFGPDQFRPGKVLIIQEDFSFPGACNAASCSDPNDEGRKGRGYSGAFILAFASAVTLTSLDFFALETNQANGDVKLFGRGGVSLGSFATPRTGGDNMWKRLMFGTSGVSGVERVEIRMGGSGAIDNVSFAPVPLPAAVWMLGSGLLALFGVARRRSMAS